MKYSFLIFTVLIFISCQQEKESILKEFNCNTQTNVGLEKINDVRNLFTVSLPKHWKTNLYYDNSQTSIYSADTTKNLTNSILIDQTLIHQELNFNDEFYQKIKNNSIKLQLKDSIFKQINYLNNPTFLQYSKGKKGSYTYQILQIFSKINATNFLHSKIEVYGDSLVENRICEALNLIAKTEVK